MKKNIIALLLCTSMLFLSACDERTPYGECVGLIEEKQPDLIYDVDAGNIAVAIILSETLIVPAIVVLDMIWCPVGQVETSQQTANEKAEEE